MELEPRTTAPAHATGAVEFVALEDVSGDATFRLRDEGDVGPLAASMGRLGQLVPIELRPLAAPAPGVLEPSPRAPGPAPPRLQGERPRPLAPGARRGAGGVTARRRAG